MSRETVKSEMLAIIDWYYDENKMGEVEIQTLCQLINVGDWPTYAVLQKEQMWDGEYDDPKIDLLTKVSMNNKTYELLIKHNAFVGITGTMDEFIDELQKYNNEATYLQSQVKRNEENKWKVLDFLSYSDIMIERCLEEEDEDIKYEVMEMIRKI